MTTEDNGSLDHVHSKYGWFRETKAREEREIAARVNLNDIYDGYYPEED